MLQSFDISLRLNPHLSEFLYHEPILSLDPLHYLDVLLDLNIPRVNNEAGTAYPGL